MATDRPSDFALPLDRGVPKVWGDVPKRNKHFTGREELLRILRQRIASEGVTALAPRTPHALHGLGGVGKTQLAIEYAHRFQTDYDVVWWISADQNVLVPATIARLAPRLGITGIALRRTDVAVAAVLDALRRGEPYPRWLMIFDNADQYEAIRDWMPQGAGHVLVTSRNHRWANVAETIEVKVFARKESVQFLKRRIPNIIDSDADMLADNLGDLPLALEQAGALLAETAMSVATFLELFEQQTSKVLEENQPYGYPVPVAAAWSVAMQRISKETPHAMDLLRLYAFFGPEPIPMKLMDRGYHVLAPPLNEAFGDPLVRGRAIRALGRYALASIDFHRNTLQVHRIIQKVIRAKLSSEQCAALRHEVHMLLSTADPGAPDEFKFWSEYRALLAHVEPSALLECNEASVRRFAENMVRYLYDAGDFLTARSLAEQALARWVDESGEDHLDVLIMRRHLGLVLWALGDHPAAHALNRVTLDRMREILGPDHEETLILLNTHGADLRARGEFAAALELDKTSVEHHRQVFGDDHPRTFMAANNLAVDYLLNGNYPIAEQLETQTYRDRLDFYGRNDDPNVLFSLAVLSRIMRHAGEYAAAVNLAQQVYMDYEEAVRQGVLSDVHPWVLLQAKGLSIGLRKIGKFAESLVLATEVYERYRRAYSYDHPDTLAAAINLGNAKRVAGNIEDAVILLEEAAQRYDEKLGANHPYTYGASVDLAIVRRRLGDSAAARVLLEHALEGLDRSISRDHDITVTCATNLASALADLGELERARQLGKDTLRRFRKILGEDHPHTLACAANLALDMRALGEENEAATLSSDTIIRYRKLLGENHPDAIAASRGRRLDLDFDPPPL